MSSSSNVPFTFGIYKSLERLKQLVNNEYESNVTFKVGRAGRLIHAHKMIISMASEVFFTQFNGNFAEATETHSRENPVMIEDIEPETFLMLMEYIYCDKIQLTYENALGIYYASQKYMLQELIDRCETFFKTAIDESNALIMLDQNHLHRFPAIDEKCLAIIQENPLKFFKLHSFLKINQRTVEMIAASRKMNCYKDHLLDAIDRWKNANDSKQCAFVLQLEDVLWLKLHSFSKSRFSTDINFILTIEVSEPLKLYGLGLFIGARKPVAEGKVSLKIDIQGENNVSVRKKVQLKSEIYVSTVLFERVTIVDEGTIEVTVKSLTASKKLICFKQFIPAEDLDDIGLQTWLNHNDDDDDDDDDDDEDEDDDDDDSESEDSDNVKHCIAYLLYNV